MKISINSTFSYIKFNLNYGSALQCYALQKYLKKRGHNPEHVRDYRANPKYILQRFKNIKYFPFFCKKIKALSQLQNFIRNYLSLSKRAYISYRGLVKHCPKAECHIAGSDQIWHNTNNFRYLTYVPGNALKLSYAASFGRASISQNMKNTIAPWLKRFDGISVREASGVDIISSMGLDAVHVLDPTLLLNWEEYPYKENHKSNYIFCYFLNLTDKNFVCFDSIKKICTKQNKELITCVPLNYSLFLKDNIVFPSVEEWLGFYKNSDFIFTNTYHGLLFCIIFKKQFIFFSQKGSSEAENERFYSLLKLLNLENRLITPNLSNEIPRLMSEKIDYNEVFKIIDKEREKTDNFFKKYEI